MLNKKKQKRENEWYRKPKYQMIFEAAFMDKEDKKSMIEAIEGFKREGVYPARFLEDYNG